jgi:hypothetical protein
MLMDVAIKRGGKNASFAVIRNYAPARIERELLAQVFDIVQQGERLHVASSDQFDSVPDPASTAATGDNSALNSHGHVRDDQRVALEAAA